MEKFWGENVRSTPTSITSGWIESTESHVILGEGVAVCCLFTFVQLLYHSTAFLFCNPRVFGVLVGVTSLRFHESRRRIPGLSYSSTVC